MFELDTITDAPCSMAHSATLKPIPDVPPRIRMTDPFSLETYFPSFGAVVLVLGDDIAGIGQMRG